VDGCGEWSKQGNVIYHGKGKCHGSAVTRDGLCRTKVEEGEKLGDESEGERLGDKSGSLCRTKVEEGERLGDESGSLCSMRIYGEEMLNDASLLYGKNQKTYLYDRPPCLCLCG
jgi:hypothetical protein